MTLQPGVIPYVEAHDGPRRLLTLTLTGGNGAGRHVPVVAIDGRRYVVVWGQVTWEIPSDRSVHVSVHLEADYLAQAASVLLPAGEGPLSFAYETNYRSGGGSLVQRA